MRNAGMEEAQGGIKIAGRNINNLRYAMTPPLKDLQVHLKLVKICKLINVVQVFDLY